MIHLLDYYYMRMFQLILHGMHRKRNFNDLGKENQLKVIQMCVQHWDVFILFTLIMLYVNVRGATSFEDLRTVNWLIMCDILTYREACQQLHLLENDIHWD